MPPCYRGLIWLGHLRCTSGAPAFNTGQNVISFVERSVLFGVAYVSMLQADYYFRNFPTIRSYFALHKST